MPKQKFTQKENFDYKNTNLNKLTNEEIAAHKKKMDANGFKTEFMGPEASLELVKKKMVEYEVIMKALGRIKK